jgi:hypothetical protein
VDDLLKLCWGSETAESPARETLFDEKVGSRRGRQEYIPQYRGETVVPCQESEARETNGGVVPGDLSAEV